MGLSDVFAQVKTMLTARLPALTPPEAVPEFLVGADKLDIEGSPPRVVWVPGAERMAGPHAQGGDGVRNPRPLQTRHCSVQIHVWGVDPTVPPDPANDLAATERLANHVFAALHDSGYGAVAAISGDWSFGQASTTRLGMLYVMTVEIQVPLTRELDIFHVVSTMPITPVLVPQVATG